jgi:hypothetical protein
MLRRTLAGEKTEACWLKEYDELQACSLHAQIITARAPALECVIASIYVEKMEAGNTPTKSVQLPPPGLCQPPKPNHL